MLPIYNNKWKLKINTTKTKILIFNGNSKDYKHTFKIGNYKIYLSQHNSSNVLNSCVNNAMWCEQSYPELFSSLGQVDLIDIQSMSHMNYKWIMVYQDHLTKFCILRPLTSKCSAEVVPSILQSDSGSLFMTNIIVELKQLRTDMKLVHGKPATHRVKDQWNVLMVTPRA